jgi:hypothetical protein
MQRLTNTAGSENPQPNSSAEAVREEKMVSINSLYNQGKKGRVNCHHNSKNKSSLWWELKGIPKNKP